MKTFSEWLSENLEIEDEGKSTPMPLSTHIQSNVNSILKYNGFKSTNNNNFTNGSHKVIAHPTGRWEHHYDSKPVNKGLGSLSLHRHLNKIKGAI